MIDVLRFVLLIIDPKREGADDWSALRRGAKS
nr:MAG TPA: hypothetical protein [Caudoviricetes sp.]